MLVSMACLVAGLLSLCPSLAQDDAPVVADEVKALPALVVTLLEEDKAPDAVEACRKLLEAHPDRSAEILPHFAKALKAAGQFPGAAEAWQEYADGLGATGVAAAALKTSAELAAEADDPEAAARTYQQLLDRFGAGFDDWSTFAGGAGYSQNRQALDLIPTVHARLAELGSGLTGDARTEALMQAAHEYPLRPATRRAALQAARALMESGSPEQAAGYALLALDQAGDHDCVLAKLRLSHNQAHYDLITQPSDPEVLTGAIDLLAEAYGIALPPEERDAVVERWLAAEEAGRHRECATCRAKLIAASRLMRDTALEPVARIVLAQWLRHMGFFVEADVALPEPGEVEAWPAVAQFAAFEVGRLRMSTGVYDEARAAFLVADEGPSPLRSEHARLLRAECLEFSGERDDAGRLYARLVEGGRIHGAVRRARMVLKRLADTSEYGVKVNADAVYWGEDRQTQGEWYSYGSGQFIIPGLMAPADLVGGELAPLPYAVHTTDPKRHHWWWNWHPVTPHPAVLRDPCLGDPMACNWDDGGEKYAVGTGPDLLFDMTVPEGWHRLSFYFVNDFNYYEPNRDYTVYLLDEGDLLAACAVRDFEGGVYHHFAVRGPRRITAHIFRDLSMNVLLQGVFLDAVPSAGTVIGDAQAYGPLGNLVGATIHGDREEFAGEFPTASVRAKRLAQLLRGRDGDAASHWREYRLLNSYGAGRAYEERALDAIRQPVVQSLGTDEAARFWSESADARSRCGDRAHAVRFTRYALQLALEHEPPRAVHLAVLDTALERLQTSVPYFVTANGRPSSHSLDKPLDQQYSLELVDRYIATAFADRRLMDAASDILPLARRSFERKRHAIATRLFAVVGIEKLASFDLQSYILCCGDPEVRIEGLRILLQSPARRSVRDEATARRDLTRAFGAAGRYDEAEAELRTLLAMDRADPLVKANAAYNLASGLRFRKMGERARKWFELVVSDYPGTVYAKLSANALREIDEPNEGEGDK